MKMFHNFFIAFTFICISACINNVYANQTNDTCAAAITENKPRPAGCGGSLTSGTCTACTAGTFSSAENSSCSTCPTNSESAAGATFCTCKNKSVPNGTWAPDVSKTTGNDCKYENINGLSCNNSSSYCADGYHKDTDTKTCKPNRTTCADTTDAHIANGVQYYGDSKCYAINCVSGYFLNNAVSTPKCTTDTNLYNQCTNEIPCTQDLKNCKNSSTSEGISGTVTANGTSKNYSKCKCRNEVEVDITNGKGKNVCKYTSGSGSSTIWGNCVTDIVTKCNAGFCEFENSKKCEAAKKGYYSPADDKTCNPCPAGSTTDGEGKSAQTECFISGATKFIDNNNKSFSLPIAEINYQ